MHSRHLRLTALAGASVAALALAGASPASAHTNHTHAPTVTVLNKTVLAPFNLSLSGQRVLVADGGTSLVSKLLPNGRLTTVAKGANPGEVAGLAEQYGGFAYSGLDFKTGHSTLTIHRRGHADVVADLSGFEASQNPDGDVHYGVDHPSHCVTKALTRVGLDPSYTGVVDSHPYSVAYAGRGVWYVAEAAGNDILRVDARGHISVAAVLPPQPTVITKAAAKAFGLPSCVVGVTYAFEPVPTDVEAGPHGVLYVTTLPGGPEDASLGARGSVYQVHPWSGHSYRLATGFLGATNLALAPDGTVYVAEIFAGQISKVVDGAAQKVVSLPGAVSLEYSAGALYAGTVGSQDDQGNFTSPGSIVRIDLS